MRELVETVDQWLAAGKPVALATVVETWGSAPRQAGAKMAVSADMQMIGSVSGGCVEAAVVDQALEVLADSQARLLHFGVSDQQAWDVGLSCGGEISIWVEPLDTAWWRAAAAHPALTTLTVVEGAAAGAKLALDQRGSLVYANAILPDAQVRALADAPHQATPGRESLLGCAVMIDPAQEQRHLIMVGGVHIAIALSQYARVLGMAVTLIDPRQAFATAERFPGVTLIHEYPDRALASIPVGRNTFLALLTHDPKIDDPALEFALRSDAAYIGVLGSRRTHALRLERLRQRGLTDQDFARLHAPIGLSIGAKSPEEIALAVMAEIISVSNRP